MEQNKIDNILSNISDEFSYFYIDIDQNPKINIIHKDNISHCRIYWFNDDNITVYLDDLGVHEDHKKKGLGTKLQEIRENIGRELGMKQSMLWVVKNTWQHEWYKRRGYVDDIDYGEEAVWMIKQL